MDEFWNATFSAKTSPETSWHQAHLELSLALIARAGLPLEAAVIDVGCGDSTLLDDLLALGYRDLTGLDISSLALQRSQARLGEQAGAIEWIEADLCRVELPPARYDLWHDRAVFHFLTEQADRAAYAAQARRALKPGGRLIIAAFAWDGPQRCSGLPAMRYTANGLVDELGAGFTLLESRIELHRTPAGGEQKFIYTLLKHDSPAMNL